MRIRSSFLAVSTRAFIAACLLGSILYGPSAFADTGQVNFVALGSIAGTGSFTLVGNSLSINGFSVSPGLSGPGTTDTFFGATVTLFGDGSASGSASGLFDSPLGAGVLIDFTSWSLVGVPGNFTLDIFGEGFCEDGCPPTGTGIGPIDVGPAFLTLSASNIVVPTPEPSSLLLLGTGLLGLGPFLRRRFTRT